MQPINANADRWINRYDRERVNAVIVQPIRETRAVLLTSPRRVWNTSLYREQCSQ